MTTTEYPFRYPDKCTLVPIDSIDYNGRARQDFGNLQDLADSFVSVGLIHPPTLTINGNVLIAGGRRLEAMKLLGVTSVPVLYREHLETHEVRELELHENIKRLNMSWQEQVLLIHDTHRLKRAENIKVGKSWNQAETGQLLGCAQAHVSHALMLGRALISGDEEILKCKTSTDAIKLLLKRKGDEAVKLKAQKTGVLQPNKPKIRTGDGTVKVNLDDDNDDSDETDKPVGHDVMTQSNVEFDLSTFHCGDFQEVCKSLPDGCVNHVVTDIPYGIDMNNLDTLNDIESVKDTHTVEGNISLFKPFLEQAYRLIGERGFCVFWYDLDHHNLLQQLAVDAGFKVQRWPLVWNKTHRCRNSTAQFNYTKATEVAMVCRKGDAVLQSPAIRNFFSADGSVERKMYDHPFVKPFEAWEFILNHIAYKGQKILDPFAGQMSCPRAVINMGMVPWAIELDPLHFVKGVDAVVNLVEEITNDGATFVNDPRAEVAKLIPSQSQLDEEVDSIKY